MNVQLHVHTVGLPPSGHFMNGVNMVHMVACSLNSSLNLDRIGLKTLLNQLYPYNAMVGQFQLNFMT